MSRPDSLPITILVTLLVAVGSFAIAVYTPSMPAIAEEFAASTDQVKLTLTVFMLGFALGQLVYGPVSDRWGRRGVLLAGLAVFIAGDVACVLATSIEHMLAGRFLQALGACAGPVLGRAVVRDVHGRRNTARVFAWMGTALALAPVIGPTVGGHLHVWFGWRASFLLLTGMGAVLMLAIILFLPETNRTADAEATDFRRMMRNFATLLGDRPFLGYLLCGSFIYSGLFCYMAIAPFLIIDGLGLTPEKFGFLSIFTTTSYLVGTVIAARLSPGWGIDRIIRIGTWLALGGGVLMLAVAEWVLSIPAIVGPMMIFAVGMGLVLPNSLAGGMIPFPRMAGSASALLGFGQQGMAAAATIVAVAFPQDSALSVGLCLAGLGAAAALAHFVLLRPRTALAGEEAASD
jgi:DHA1 family bicyclomycin/chloramphenicol resistance-like MFS transporter